MARHSGDPSGDGHLTQYGAALPSCRRGEAVQAAAGSAGEAGPIQDLRGCAATLGGAGRIPASVRLMELRERGYTGG
jgi:hypothetical protein